MKKYMLAFSVALLLSGVASIVHAQDAVVTNEGDSAAGKDKSAACVSCHGEDGNSVMPTFPKLAQQHPTYIVKQLRAFKDGSRSDPVMSGMAMTINAADMPDIAAYYAAQPISANTEPSLPPADDAEDGATAPTETKTMLELLKIGSNLYRNGDLKLEISACIACHGPSGEGNKPAAFPLLQSQHADYLIKTLNDFKSGARSKNPDNMMVMIAKKMTDEEIKAVSYYISTLK
ncbi:MAG: cytochrome c4 [Gammaproteobacteria bacterium]|nr:cytochrome c4 [Gammaproteobacteria bacterium]